MTEHPAAEAQTEADILNFSPATALDFARSEVFARLFRDGMGLVEETASYLDGMGRQESKLLSRSAALAYVAESMKLTTRLMQIASWLLVQRAVKENEMTLDEAGSAKFRLPTREPRTTDANVAFDELPEALKALIHRADRLYARVSRIDHRIYVATDITPVDSPVAGYVDALRAAFDL